MSKLEQAIRAAGKPMQSNNDGFSKEFIFAPDFVGFDGHFPGNPILPAVVQLMTGAETAAESAGSPLTTTNVSRAKFLKQIKPGDILTVTGSLTHKEDAIVAPIRITCGDETAASFTLTLTPTLTKD